MRRQARRHLTTLSLKALLRRAGLPPIRFHDLRHTFATLQLAAGTNPKIVSEVLGHKEVAITLDRYSHALPTLHTKAMGGSTRSSAAEPTRRSVAAAIRAPIRAPRPPRRLTKCPIRAWIGPRMANLVPHTRMRGIPVSCDPIWVD